MAEVGCILDLAGGQTTVRDQELPQRLDRVAQARRSTAGGLDANGGDRDPVALLRKARTGASSQLDARAEVVGVGVALDGEIDPAAVGDGAA